MNTLSTLDMYRYSNPLLGVAHVLNGILWWVMLGMTLRDLFVGCTIGPGLGMIVCGCGIASSLLNRALVRMMQSEANSRSAVLLREHRARKRAK